MTKQLEAQSGIAMTPSSTIGSSNTSTTSSVAGLAKTSEDLQKLRTEQLARLQQNVQRQAAMAAQAVQKRSNEEWLRNKLLLEQEHLRLLRLHEQQLKQTGAPKGNTVTTATATSIADSLLAQQQQVMRQQQMLRDMLEKQQKQQHAQLQLHRQLQKGDKTTSTTVTTKPCVTTAPSNYAAAKRKLKTSFDMELEALARVCIRVANARTDSEMRQALDKMTSWLHRCTELMLLQIAQRDYRDSIAHRRPMLIQQDRWPADLQAKSEFITQKIVQMLGAFLLREKNKIAQQEAAAKAAVAVNTAVATAAASTPATVATTPATGTANATTATPAPSANSASAATPATVVQHNIPTSTTGVASTSIPGNTTPVNNAAQKSPASAATTGTTTTATTPSIILAPAVRIPVKRDMVTVEREYAELKTQLQAKQVEVNQKAKAKRDAAKLEASKSAGIISNYATTAAMVAASYKRPLQVEIPGSVKKPRTESYGASSSAIATGYRPSTTSVPPISPRVAKQFYDLDLATRTSTEPDDKMYLPPKIVSKIMYSVLPGDHEGDTATAGSTVKGEGRTPSPAISPARSAQEHESSRDSISISDDAVTFMQECVTEFLLYFTSEARDLSVMQNRRTRKGVGLSISGSNVVESMENLGFTSYARVLSGYNEKVKASQDAAARKKMERKKFVQQQALEKAAAAAKAASSLRHLRVL
ncbi:Hypothetical protein PHPALM_673 [Phytophthora palmivora]|uniref:Transcription factor CBF/NF-Y/archaeal histone domain-containing protein n=1 Tax=Phytophthora palmivora TaxID=4796 RepID=A0A2P4YU85_9STRA|nr:Hypothetical protein PHPALM_673 [Phytophthora palmivora]